MTGWPLVLLVVVVAAACSSPLVVVDIAPAPVPILAMSDCFAGPSSVARAAEMWPEMSVADIVAASIRAQTPIIVQGTLRGFVADDLGTNWAHGYHPRRIEGIPCQVLKLSTDATTWKDPQSAVEFSGNWAGSYSVAAVESIAEQYPALWWILGEEDNYWHGQCPWEYRKFSGLVCDRYPSPEVYGRWLHDYIGAIERGHERSGATITGGIVPFYLVQDCLPTNWHTTKGVTPTGLYMWRVAAEWRRRGWGDIPADAVTYNFRPYACPATDAEADGHIDKSVQYWTAKRTEMQRLPWLRGVDLWAETDQGKTYRNWYNAPVVPPTLAQWCAQAKRVLSLIRWAEATPWVGAVLLYGTITDADTQAPLQASSLYAPGGYGGDDFPAPKRGDLSIAGRALRDRELPKECI